MSDTELVECIASFPLLAPDIRNKLLEHFSILNASQKQAWIQCFSDIKKEISTFLIELKASDICTFESIHTKILQKTKQYIQHLESQEWQTEQEHIENIFDTW